MVIQPTSRDSMSEPMPPIRTTVLAYLATFLLFNTLAVLFLLGLLFGVSSLKSAIEGLFIFTFTVFVLYGVLAMLVFLPLRYALHIMGARSVRTFGLIGAGVGAMIWLSYAARPVSLADAGILIVTMALAFGVFRKIEHRLIVSAQNKRKLAP